MKILCFGDSNTYGYIPGGGRYDRRTRWPGRLKGLLGKQHQVIEEGLNGRTTVYQEPMNPERCGADAIGAAVELHSPLDLLIIMLGTNDCKAEFHADSRRIAENLETVLKKAEACTKRPFRALIIAPAPLSEKAACRDFGDAFDETSIEVSKGLAKEYAKLAAKYGYDFLDAAKVASVSRADGVHLDENAHEALALAVAERLRDIPWNYRKEESHVQYVSQSFQGHS